MAVNEGYTGGGKTTVSTYGAGNKAKAVAFGGAQPERTQAEKDKIAAMLAEWKTPEVKAKAREYAENHDDDDNDF